MTRPLLPGNTDRIQLHWPVLLPFILTGIALLAYSAIRSATIEFTLDEIYTWKHFGHGFSLYPDEYGTMSANNHWLNSWLMRFSSVLFGEANWALRLPNQLAHAAYLFFTAALSLRFRSRLYAFAAFLLFNLHPYLVDFFSVARGYGLSFAGIAACMYFLHRFSCREKSIKMLACLLLSGAIAFYANFAVICFFIAAAGVAGLLVVTGEQKQKWTQLAFIGAFIAITIGIALPHLLKLQQQGSLYYGGESLWGGTARSVAVGLLYGAGYTGTNPFASSHATIITIFILILGGTVWLVLQKGLVKWSQTTAGRFVLVFFITLLMLVMQKLLTGAKYPLDRTGLFLFLLLLFALVAVIHENLGGKILGICGAVIALPVAVHMLCCLNTSYIFEWKPAYGTKTIAEELSYFHERLPEGQKQVKVATQLISGASLDYIREQEKLEWLESSINWKRDQPSGFDFYLVEGWDLDHYSTDHWIPVDTLPYSGNILFMDPAFAARIAKR